MALIGLSQSQAPTLPLYLKSGTQQLTRNIDQLSELDSAAQSNTYAGVMWAVVQFNKIPNREQVRELKSEGVQLLEYLPKYAYLAEIVLPVNQRALVSSNARALYFLETSDKIAANCFAPNPGEQLVVWYHKRVTVEKVKTALLSLEEVGVPVFHEGLGNFTISYHQDAVDKLSQLPFIYYIEGKHTELVSDIHENPNTNRSNTINSTGFSGSDYLTGKGVTALIVDGGNIQPHLDFSQRITNYQTSNWGGYGEHAEVVSGVFGGAGNLDPYNRGVAYKTKIYTMKSGYLLDNIEDFYSSYHVRISNNSYGTRFPAYGLYTSESRAIDLVCNEKKDYLHFSSASNHGNETYLNYPKSFHTVNESFQSGKNTMVLANISIYDTIMPSSSRGPAKDGRIKPEFGANGSHLNAVSRGNDYAYVGDGGTSSATPSTAGVAALLSEHYYKTHSAWPKAALMRNVLANTADDIGNHGPDFTYGYGRINGRRALDLLKSSNYVLDSVGNGFTETYTISVPAGLGQLNVMLTWNDPAASAYVSKALVNDLDIEVVAPSSAIYSPWILKHNAANVEDLALFGRDSINNMEQVTVVGPQSGTWTIRVKGQTVTSGKQHFYLTYEELASDITVTYPYANEKFEPNQTFLIRWDAYDLSTNSFTLEYTTNNGSNWTTIDNNVNKDIRFYEWTAPNVSSGTCKVRVSRNGTSTTDESNAVFTIADRPSGVAATALCQDYAKLVWNSVSGAQSYSVWYLDTVMKVLRTVSDTTDTVALAVNHERNWFGVSANYVGYTGQRANSVRPTESTSSACPYAHDLSILELVAPVSGRIDFTDELTSAEQIKMRCVNKGTSSISNFKLHYRIGNGSVVTETYSGNLASGDTLEYTFSTTANLSLAGTYVIDTWTSHISDTKRDNDSLLHIEVRQLANPLVSLPYNQGFNTIAVPETSIETVKGLKEYPTLDFETDAYGRMRIVNGKGLYLESQSTLNNAVNYLTFNLNLSSYSNKTVGLKFDWTQFAESRHSNDKLWIRGADTMPWVEALDLYTVFGGYTKKDNIQYSPVVLISDVLAQNNQSFTKTAQLRFGQEDNGVSVVTAFPNIGTGGVLLDELEIFEVGPDIELVSHDAPAYYNCGYTSYSPYVATVRNKHHQSQTGVKVRFQLDNAGIRTHTFGAIPGQSTTTYSFTPGTIVPGWHTAKFWVEYASDTISENDTASITFFNSRKVKFFPYTQDFETDNGDWWTDGKNSSWDWGTPSATDINTAGSGSKCWATKLSGIHNSYELSYLNSPCFETNNLKGNDAILEALVFADSRRTWVEYTNDNGVTWTKLGAHGEGTNWYNDEDDHWDGSFRGWHRAYYEVPNSIARTNDQIMFRFVFSANDNFNWHDGFAVDSFSFKVLNQDLELVSLTGPSTRCGMTDEEQVTIAVANLSTKRTNWVPIRYTVNNGPIIKDSINHVDAMDTVYYHLKWGVDFSAPIEYTMDIWLESDLDKTRANDSITDFTFTSKPQISSIPYLESFETNIGGWHAEGTGTTWEQGTVDANLYPNTASHGVKAWATNLSGNHYAGEVSYLVSPCFDLRGIESDPYFEFHTKYSLRPNTKYFLEYSEDGSSWTKLGSNGGGLNWYNHASHYFSGAQSSWTKTRWQLALGAVTDSSSIQIRFVFENDLNDVAATEGIALDNTRLYEIRNDLELTQITSPESGCGLGSSEDIIVQVRNNSSAVQNGATVYYAVNGGAVQSKALTSINAGATSTLTLSSSTDFSASGIYELKTWVSHSTDTYRDNDTLVFSFVRSSAVSGFPYHEGFETTNGAWFSTGANSSWNWGIPSGAPISTAVSGQKAWGTNISGSHNSNELSYLHSPCFDVDAFTGEAHVSFNYYRYLPSNGSVWFEFSDDDGNTWSKLGAIGEGVGWYNDAGNYWKGQGSDWSFARMRLPLATIANKDKIRFRFVLNAGAQVDAGWGIDDFSVYEVIDDAEAVAIESPDENEGTGSKSVRISVSNHSKTALSDVVVKYQFNASSVVVDTITSVPSDDTVSFTFKQALQIGSAGSHTLRAWVAVSNDNIVANDTSVLNMSAEATISSFPYYEGFEDNNGGWAQSGSASSWEWGSPSDNLTETAAHKAKCWGTNLDGDVNANELSYLTSPPFDFRSLSQNPVISFYNIFSIHWQSKYYLEYSEDGSNWVKIGTYNSGQNWYNNGGHFWSQAQTEWKEAVYDIPLDAIVDSSKVRLRFVLDVGSQNAYSGIALDDVFVGNKGNDLQVVEVNAPDTSCSLGSAETVSVALLNLGNTASGVYNLHYSVNGGNTVTEQFSSINALSPAQVSFSTKADVSNVQKHEIRVWTSLNTDHYHLNDTVDYTTFKSATISALPYVQNFESGLDGWITGGANSSWEVGTPSSSSFTSAANGTKCVATNLDGPCNVNEFSHLISPCFDFRGMTGNPTILFNLAFKLGWTTPGLYLEYSEDGHTWTKLGSSGSGNNWYNNNWDNLWDQSSLNWKLASYEIPLASITDSSAVKFRFVLKGSLWSAEEGVVIDDIRIQQVTEDLELVSINAPGSGAGLGLETVSVQVKNNSSQNISNAFLYYQLNDGVPVKDTVSSINSGATITFHFTEKVDASTIGAYTLNAWMAHGNDNQPLNDTVKAYSFTHTAYIAAFPYFSDFENDDGTFYGVGANSTWEHGQPSANNSNFKKAASGTKLWATNLDGHFTFGEQSYLYSPVFDLSSFTSNPILSMGLAYNVGFAVNVTVEYSEDGSNWTGLSSSNNGINWSDWGWTNEKTHFHTVSTELPVGTMTDKDSVQLRVYFNDQGWGFETYEGVIMDNFHIHEKASMHSGTSAKGLTKTVSGTSWVHFEKNGNRVMSIHPQGQNLGSTTVDCYIDQGNTRSYSNQYILDRSWVVNPAAQPNSDVRVRVYFTEQELDSMRVASNCQGCTAVEDAYELGFTKYHGTNEDSVLTNNTSGTYTYFSSSNVTMLPYGRGYCAEFTVSSFSEVFGNDGGIGGNAPLPVDLLYFDANLERQGVLLSWETATELNNDEFEVQRSTDGIHFSTIARVKGQGTTLKSTAYKYFDSDWGVLRNHTNVFYRLRQNDFGGATAYSKTVSLWLNEEETSGLEVWPTTFTQGIQVENRTAEAKVYNIVNVQGETLKTIRVDPGVQYVKLETLASGIYYLQYDHKGLQSVQLVKVR